MNPIDHATWSPHTATKVASAEHAPAQGRPSASSKLATALLGTGARRAGHVMGVWRPLSLALMLAWGGLVLAMPNGGVVSAGAAHITQTPGQMTITQSTAQVAINLDPAVILSS
ncbi:hypothetical protein [Limnohabitans sp.]|jgi:hypothetical protein|uniref:hypothetical protein n=1 Tax=Limnohabitans sp. TaxID=1907725 RepID=UPI0037BFADE4